MYSVCGLSKSHSGGSVSATENINSNISKVTALKHLLRITIILD